MASAELDWLLYNWISVIYERANHLCPDCFRDQANGPAVKVTSGSISVVCIRKSQQQQGQNTADDVITV